MTGRRFIGCGVLAMGVFVWTVGLSEKLLAADPDPMKLLLESKAACDKVKDFTAVFTKQEQIDGELRESETVKMKLRWKPFSVYMLWFQNPNKGREVIYEEGKNDGNIVGHQPVGPLNFGKKVKPDSADALKQSRRPITQAGFHNAINLIVQTTELGLKRKEVAICYVGTEVFDSRPVHVVLRMFTAKRDDYPVSMGVFYLDKQLMVPVKVAGYDWDHRLSGLYQYTDVKLNVGLTDKDFDVESPEYDFPRAFLPKFKFPWPFGGKKD